MRFSRVTILAALLSFIALAMHGQDKPAAPGCHYFGHSPCGGTDKAICAPQQRYFSQQCQNGQVNNSCVDDNYCASTSKGRVVIWGFWKSNIYKIDQHGDTLYITGGSAGAGSGSFTGPMTIEVTWPGNLKYKGTISLNPQTHVPNTITWDHPAGNVWTRPF